MGFGSDVQTGTNANGAATDHALPGLGALNLRAMGSPTALQGTNGTDCLLMLGDQWEEIDGNATVHITKNLKVTVDQNEQRKVLQNSTTEVTDDWKFTVWGQSQTNFGGVYIQVNHSPRFETYFHTLTQDHKQPSKINQPTTLLEKFNVVVKITNVTLSWTRALDVGVKTTAFSGAFFDAGMKVISLDNKVFSAKKEGFAVKDLDAGVHLRGAIAEIKAMKVKAAVSHVKAIGANLCAGIALNADSPFA